VHLGVTFLANMELGYLMPPLGENLFLSSYRFERPLSEVYRSTLPYSVIVLVVVVLLLITYVPGLTLWLVHLLEGRGMLSAGEGEHSSASDGRLSRPDPRRCFGINRRRTGSDQHRHTNSDTNQHVPERVPAHLVDPSDLRERNRLTTAIRPLHGGHHYGIREDVLTKGVGPGAIRAFDPDDAVDANSADA
jgi:hypothetical protein